MRHSTSTLARFVINALTPLLCLVLFLAVQPSARASNTVYAISDSTKALGTLNLNNGSFTAIGGSPGSVSSGLAELGSNLYTGTYHGNTLYRVNLDGSITMIGNGSISGGGGYRCTGATTASLYGFDVNLNLYSINAATGATTMIGPLGVSGSDLGCSANGAVLYATLDNASQSCPTSTLYSINTSSGAATTIGCTGVANINDLVYQNGVLYGNAQDGNLYTLNTTTGTATFEASAGIVFSGMALPASTITLLHKFTNGQDGGTPLAGLTFDRAGNLYGTTAFGGSSTDGTVYKLTHKGSGWTFSPLYEFEGGNDGTFPEAPVTVGTDGSLYGVTSQGGPGNDGTVYRLRPPATSCRSALCFWTETQLYAFTGTNGDGYYPGYGAVIFDSAGNLYGTTIDGGKHNNGSVYKLTPAGPPWMESVIYSFAANPDGCHPYGGLTFDPAGDLYGTTYQCGVNSAGTVYQLTPSGNMWTEGILYAFEGQSENDGASPYGGLILDPSGNLFGTTSHGGIGGGTVFELTPSNGGWNYSQIYEFPGTHLGPYGGLVRDSAGNLYGTTYAGGPYSSGTVFELMPSNGGWIYSELYDFTGGMDGAGPYGSLVLDAAGNLYGTTSAGGNAYGTIFELMPTN